MNCKMINITNEQKQYLSSYIEDIESLIIADDIQLLLDRIDDEIVDTMLRNTEEPGEPDEIGIKLQRIYDQIYNQN